MSHRPHTAISRGALAPRTLTRKHKRRMVRSCALLLAPLTVGLAACGTGDSSDGSLASAPYDATDAVSVSAAADSTDVDPDKPLKVTAEHGDTLTDVFATDASGRVVPGELSADGKSWHSTGPLAAGARYTLQVSTENQDGAPGRRSLRFGTKAAEAKHLDVKLGPSNGTYGVGMPLTAELSHPVKKPAQREMVERALRVDSKPHVEGSWHWVNSKELHYRPRSYWPAHASITLRSSLKGLKVREGLYGGKSKPVRMKTGDRIVAVADASSLEMTVKKNGKTIRSVPITTGKSGYETRNGIKVILTKEPYVRMTSASIGAGDFYDLGVHWATRLTNSGEYVHGAPWSVGSQGVSNTSHGCTGMSSSNAKWFFDLVNEGDIVQHVNTSGETMAPFGNGFGDWNMDWKKWRAGSAVNSDKHVGSGPADAARLRPQV
ncbi:Ig-like domain-containing protein [Streptomyces tubbatahanensis]|uniref:Ig-like domain-containing protein n=1 Tax=Streptomyces tubbatahanensis TaxID=2923272 RepID=A0ABY3XQD1_9ACTN|nr:Ig-like domain-containing protein [Streptomyces tubbatahanensis]UNS96615.1 Ig-like domain-containing protein [Streptomyces tubbatahanensis]